MLFSLFKEYRGPSFAIRLWNGWHWQSSEKEAPTCTVIFHTPEALQLLIARPSEITLGEAFLSKQIDVEGDLFSVFDAIEHVLKCPRGQRQRALEIVAGILTGVQQWWAMGRLHSQGRDRIAISHHYDQPVDFYRPWLGETLAYSCAYFQSESEDIDTAQTNKLEMICRKLRLKPGERLLDIGCGWGSLILHAASMHDVSAHGITLSRQQQSVAEDRIAQAMLTESCYAELLDYRNATSHLSSFDKIASVGMFEHVGRRNLLLYFRTAYALLKPGGVFLNHGIARSLASSTNTLMNSPLMRSLITLPLVRMPQTSFVDRYVFPGGELVKISEAIGAAEAAGFEVRDVENLREHYELTLRCWAKSLQENADGLLRLVSETTYRIWLLYIAGSAAAFRRGDISIFQVLLSRPEEGRSNLPLTRRDWYIPDLTGQEMQA
jgi:cyclopropane-fatty-acyl-phospholipid synthase